MMTTHWVPTAPSPAPHPERIKKMKFKGPPYSDLPTLKHEDSYFDIQKFIFCTKNKYFSELRSHNAFCRHANFEIPKIVFHKSKNLFFTKKKHIFKR